MKSKLFCNLARQAQAIRPANLAFFVAIAILGSTLPVRAEAPGWMHALVSVPITAHDEKTNAVLLYEEQNINVISTDKIKTTVRRAYKILRPDGRDYGTVVVHFSSPAEKINGLHGWCIPASGKDYEVKAKD